MMDWVKRWRKEWMETMGEIWRNPERRKKLVLWTAVALVLVVGLSTVWIMGFNSAELVDDSTLPYPEQFPGPGYTIEESPTSDYVFLSREEVVTEEPGFDYALTNRNYLITPGTIREYW